MKVAGRVEEVGDGQLVDPELTDGLQKAVPHATVDMLGDHERRTDQAIKRSKHRSVVVGAEHTGERSQVEPADEHGGPPQHVARNGKHLDTMCCIVFELEDGRLKSGTEHFFDLHNWDQFWS